MKFLKFTVIILTGFTFSVLNLFCIGDDNSNYKDLRITAPRKFEHIIATASRKKIILQKENKKIKEIKNKLEFAIKKIMKNYDYKTDETAVVVLIKEQELYLIKDLILIKTYPVSTSKYGIGSKSGSNKTPLGSHKIQAKIGDGAPIGTIFKSKINTGRIAEIIHEKEDTTDEDYITTRVLPLRGLEYGINKGKGVDSYSRSIYIHGTQEEGLIGVPASHGCIRMLNKDVIEFFDSVEVNNFVEIMQ